mmetsp:Transcript_145902/g.406394  ORF Transcript_145902/g.406394 Transcript_145902/m.406394 type:complete len:135 (+) Transcript_145902:121-525(+)
MTFAARARWATCRAARLSAWSHNLNMNLRFHRGIAASPLLRLAAETRPLGGFAEQRCAVAGGTSAQFRVGEELEDSSSSAAAQAIAAILKDVASFDTAATNSFTEMLDLSVLCSIYSTSSCGLIKSSTRRGSEA